MATRYFEYRLARADVVIFLDVPLYICLYRVFKRAFTHFGRAFFASAPGCPESFPSREFLTYVWNFNTEQKPHVVALLSQYKDDKKVFVVTNQQDLDQLINNFL